MIGPRFVLRMAWRESRAGKKRLWLLTGAITAGVAALVAINSFTQNLRTSVAEQARALLGADLSITSRQKFTPRVEALLDSLVAPDSAAGRPAGRRALQVSFPAMAYVPRTRGVRLVQVRAVEGGYPFYGEITTHPAVGGARFPTATARWSTRRSSRRWAGRSETRSPWARRGSRSRHGAQSAGRCRDRHRLRARVYIPGRNLPATGLLRFGSAPSTPRFSARARRGPSRSG